MTELELALDRTSEGLIDSLIEMGTLLLIILLWKLEWAGFRSDLVFFTTTFGVVFHMFPIDFPHCCHAFDASYPGLYVTNVQQGKLWVRGVTKVWDLEA